MENLKLLHVLFILIGVRLLYASMVFNSSKKLANLFFWFITTAIGAIFISGPLADLVLLDGEKYNVIRKTNPDRFEEYLDFIKIMFMMIFVISFVSRFFIVQRYGLNSFSKK